MADARIGAESIQNEDGPFYSASKQMFKHACVHMLMHTNTIVYQSDRGSNWKFPMAKTWTEQQNK